MEKGTEKGTAKKMTAPVSSEQISRTDEFTLGFNEGTFDPHLHDVSNEFQHSDHNRLEGPCLQPGRGKEQSGLLDCVDTKAWHIRPTEVLGSSGH